MQNCEDCLKKNLWRNTGRTDKNGAVIRQCTNCGHYQSEPPPQGLEYPKRFLYYDIENTKMTVTSEVFDLYVPTKRLKWQEITKPSFLICWSAAWVNEDTKPGDDIRVFSDVVTPQEAKKGDDRRCLANLADLMNKADYWVGHNSKAFDTKRTNTRMILNRMPVLDLTIREIDTLTIARKHFKNDSNTLGYWMERFGNTGKDKMVSEDWDECKAGNQTALNKMRKYNKQDVRGGAQVYLEFRDYLKKCGVRLYR